MGSKYTRENLRISNHAKERYAERIMDKDGSLEINTFLAQHEEKVREDIFKMIEYGDLIYTGKSISDNNKQIVDVFLNGTWVILVDPSKYNVITLYNINLGVDHDFNLQYIKKLKEKLDKAKKAYDTAVFDIMEQTHMYEQMIRENSEQISEYNKIVRSLQSQNDAYEKVLETLEANKFVTEKEVRDIVATMIGRKVF